VPTIKALDADPSLAVSATEARQQIWAAMDANEKERGAKDELPGGILAGSHPGSK